MSLGSPRILDSAGTGYSGECTNVPFDLLWEISQKAGTPIVQSGTNNVTYTLNLGVNRKFKAFLGQEFVKLSDAESYTWAAGANNEILNSSGVVTADQSPATGIWYYYLGNTATGTVVIRPSQTAPSHGPGGDGTESGYYTHPGTSKTNAWIYVGFALCTATTPAFASFTKIGKTYNFANSVLTVATAGTSFATALWTGAKALPAHEGIKVAGDLETGATAGNAAHVAATSGGLGEQRCQTSAAVLARGTFGPIAITDGELYYKHTGAAGDIFVTSIEDVV